MDMFDSLWNLSFHNLTLGGSTWTNFVLVLLTCCMESHIVHAYQSRWSFYCLWKWGSSINALRNYGGFWVIPFKNISSYKTIIRDRSLVVGWLVGYVLRPIDSEVIQRWHPHLLSLAKDVKLGFYTVPTRNRTPGRRLAVHYTTAAHTSSKA